MIGAFLTGRVIQGVARHLLTAGGGVLVAQGWTDEATAKEIVGAAATLAGLVWSAWDKRQG